MCFSATASFTSGIILTTVGIFTVRHVRSNDVLPFASIPILFGIQQIVEGIVWISFDMLLIHKIATYIYIMFSHVLWPTFVPLTIWIIEKKEVRKKILLGITTIGIGVSIYLFFHVVSGPTTCSIIGHSIYYSVKVPFPLVSFALYFFATCIGSMVSSSYKIRIFGTSMLIAFFVAHLFYPETLFSIWCFFSAILSLIIYVHVKDLKNII